MVPPAQISISRNSQICFEDFKRTRVQFWAICWLGVRLGLSNVERSRGFEHFDLSRIVKVELVRIREDRSQSQSSVAAKRFDPMAIVPGGLRN